MVERTCRGPRSAGGLLLKVHGRGRRPPGGPSPRVRVQDPRFRSFTRTERRRPNARRPAGARTSAALRLRGDGRPRAPVLRPTLASGGGAAAAVVLLRLYRFLSGRVPLRRILGGGENAGGVTVRTAASHTRAQHGRRLTTATANKGGARGLLRFTHIFASRRRCRRAGASLSSAASSTSRR